MTGLLLMISFIIHIVLLFTVYKLSQQLQLLKQSNHQETKDLLNSFLVEIREENDLLQQKWNEKSNQHTAPKKSYDVDEGSNRSSKSPKLRTREKQDNFSPSIQGQVYQLYDQGVPVEEIAKQLDRGKTEIELMIKFKKNNK